MTQELEIAQYDGLPLSHYKAKGRLFIIIIIIYYYYYYFFFFLGGGGVAA